MCNTTNYLSFFSKCKHTSHIQFSSTAGNLFWESNMLYFFIMIYNNSDIRVIKQTLENDRKYYTLVKRL